MKPNRYIDFKKIEEVPNKYNLTPKKLKTLKVIDWDRLKKKCWKNTVKSKTPPYWYCHLEGSNGGGFDGDNEDEFWIGFREDGKVDYSFTSREGMCHYRFDEFYKVEDIENKWDMNVQVNTLRWLNMMLDEGILGL